MLLMSLNYTTMKLQSASFISTRILRALIRLEWNRVDQNLKKAKNKNKKKTKVDETHQDEVSLISGEHEN